MFICNCCNLFFFPSEEEQDEEEAEQEVEEYGGGGLKDTVSLLVHDPKMRQKRGLCWLQMPPASVHVSCLRALTLQINFSFQGLGFKTDVLLF